MAASRLARDGFGSLPDGRAVQRVTLRGQGGFEARVIAFGATLQALIAPDAKGRCDDVVLGHDDLAGYVAERRFFGATVGRYANRIGQAQFVLDGETVCPAELAGVPSGGAVLIRPDGYIGFQAPAWNAEAQDALGRFLDRQFAPADKDAG